MRAAQPRFSAHAASSIVALLLITVQVASKIARDTLFMSQSTARELSVAMVCSGALSVACAFYASARGRAAKPGASLAVTLSLSASCFLLEGLLVPHAPKAAACIAFGHIGALGPLAVSYLWMGFAERFRGRAAEGAFVSISSAATLGGVFGGVLAERVTRTFSMPTLLFGLAALSLALAAWGLVAARHQPQEPALGSAVPPPPLRNELTAILSDTFLRRTATLLAFTAIGTCFADYLMKASFAGGDAKANDLVIFFSLFHTFTGVLTFLVQATVGPRLVARIGVSGALALVPTVFVSFAGFGMVLWRMSTAVLLRGTDAVLSNSVFRSTYELLYTAVPTETRRSAKPLIDIVSLRAGDLMGSALVAAVVNLIPALTSPVLLTAGALIGAMSIYLAQRIGGEYRSRMDASHGEHDRRRGSFLTCRTEPA